MKQLYAALLFMCCFFTATAQQAPFVTTWTPTGFDVFNPNLEISITTNPNYTYDYTIDFGDGTVTTNVTGDITHAYASPGVYTVSITGDFPGFYFSGYVNSNSISPLTSVEQWGDIQWKSMKYAFRNCANVVFNATDTPNLSEVTDMSYAFENCTYFNSDISNWDVSNVTHMDYLFLEATHFNQPLNNWNMSNVTSMEGIFYDATNFNQPLNNWDISGLTSLKYTFVNATAFNQSIEAWNVSGLTEVYKIFDGAASFNQPLNNWNVSNWTNFEYIFKNASAFNQPLDNWDVSSGTSFRSMFESASSFNQPLNNWNMSSATNLTAMFADTQAFNQPLNNWNVSNVTSLSSTFNRAVVFNQPLESWNVSNVINFSGTFSYAKAFNQPLNNWNVTSNSTYTSGMFSYTEAFNQPLDNWDMSNVINTSYMFQGSKAFNQPLNSWDVSSVANFKGMFENSEAFDQPLDGWTLTADNFESFFDQSNVSSANYELFLQNLAQSGVSYGELGAAGMYYCTSTYRNSLISNSWEIEGDFKLADCSAISDPTAFVMLWATGGSDYNTSITIPTTGSGYNYTVDFGDGTILSNVTGDASHTYSNSLIPTLQRVTITGDFPRIYFQGVPNTNDDDPEQLIDIAQWGTNQWQSMEGAFYKCENIRINATDTPDLSLVTNMSHMFHGAINFYSNINNWDVSNVTNMSYLFAGNPGTSFAFVTYNQPLDNWDVSNVTDMSFMFHFNNKFNQNLNSWNTANVTTMEKMFNYCESYNQPLNNWDVSNVTNFSFLFYRTVFNQPLNNWNVSNATDISGMFKYAYAFNQPLNNWDVSNVTNMNGLFNYSPFNQPLDAWDVSNVTNMQGMFSSTEFNQPLNTWNVSNVTNMHGMFSGTPFNQPLDSWDVSNVTDMGYMFNGNHVFNQPLDSWDVSNVMNLNNFISSAITFNQDLSSWNLNPDVSLNSMLSYSGMLVDNYDAFLLKCATINLLDITFNSHGMYYCDEELHGYLENTLNWNIIGDNMSEDCNYVSGTVKLDTNGNGCNIYDPYVSAFMITATEGSETWSTNILNGTYGIGAVGTYPTLTIENLPNYYDSSPVSQTVDLSGTQNNAVVDFCLTTNQTAEDLSITILPLDNAIPGFNCTYRVLIGNVGTQNISNVTATFTYDNLLQTYVNATTAPTTNTSNTLTFNIASLGALDGETIDITLHTQTPPTVNSGTELSFTANVTAAITDVNTDNNTYTYEQTAVNSFDPNDKQVLQGDMVLIEDADKYLDYMIRFQNTGTANAFQVVIKDTLDTNLDWSTFTPVSASHDFSVKITNGNEVEFSFLGINLPYETADEPGSHGYISYKIKPLSTLTAGTYITGPSASIYFDYNAPIITNSVSTLFYDALSIKNYELTKQIQLYPNPSTDTFYTQVSNGTAIEKITIYNLQGQLVKEFTSAQPQYTVNNLAKGIYLVKVHTNQGILTQQLVKK